MDDTTGLCEYKCIRCKGPVREGFAGRFKCINRCKFDYRYMEISSYDELVSFADYSAANPSLGKLTWTLEIKDNILSSNSSTEDKISNFLSSFKTIMKLSPNVSEFHFNHKMSSIVYPAIIEGRSQGQWESLSILTPPQRPEEWDFYYQILLSMPRTVYTILFNEFWQTCSPGHSLFWSKITEFVELNHISYCSTEEYTDPKQLDGLIDGLPKLKSIDLDIESFEVSEDYWQDAQQSSSVRHLTIEFSLLTEEMLVYVLHRFSNLRRLTLKQKLSDKLLSYMLKRKLYSLLAECARKIDVFELTLHRAVNQSRFASFPIDVQGFHQTDMTFDPHKEEGEFSNNQISILLKKKERPCHHVRIRGSNDLLDKVVNYTARQLFKQAEHLFLYGTEPITEKTRPRALGLPHMENLIYLCLSGFSIHSFQTALPLSSMKRLSLEECRVSTDVYSSLSSVCPNLESLSIMNPVYSQPVNRISVDSGSLKRLYLGLIPHSAESFYCIHLKQNDSILYYRASDKNVISIEEEQYQIQFLDDEVIKFEITLPEGAELDIECSMTFFNRS